MKNMTTFTCGGIFLVNLILGMGCVKKSDVPAKIDLVPVVLTSNYSNVLLNTIDFTGNISDDRGYIVTHRGFCWSAANQNPSILNDTMVSAGNGTNLFSGIVDSLKSSTIYYIRAYATNMNGTGYGNIVAVKTIIPSISDADHNNYPIVQIGAQVWMAENLKVTHYCNGDAIPNITDSAAWTVLTSGAYCLYNNDALTNKALYGSLYNWYTIDDSRILAPIGWHIPSIAELKILTDFLGGDSVSGGKMKEAGAAHWLSPNIQGNNSSGYSALPGGSRNSDGTFNGKFSYGLWWSYNEYDTYGAWYTIISCGTGGVLKAIHNKSNGYSVRCLRN